MGYRKGLVYFFDFKKFLPGKEQLAGGKKANETRKRSETNDEGSYPTRKIGGVEERVPESVSTRFRIFLWFSLRCFS